MGYGSGGAGPKVRDEQNGRAYNESDWPPMVSVKARKIRDHNAERSTVAAGREYTGYLISYPVVGRGMVIFRDPHGHRMITTPVRRVLGEPSRTELYVETENSVYRLQIDGDPRFPELPEPRIAQADELAGGAS